ncbi:hypothetical protein QM012_003391 [Aureobasidium pullulans]|uniref:Galactose mutarotase-like protein n=1 Tax=Aureobasidium pullulans TaxID=5580 RepID=A0ABR0T9Q0_AURPU
MAVPSLPDTQEDILSLRQAGDIFQSQQGPSVVDVSLRALIVDHNVADQFGVILVHRHSNLEQGEAMVAFNSTATPWPSRSCNPCGGSIVPQAWRINNGKLQPYEYRFIPSESGVTNVLDEHSAFVEEFIKAIEHHGLSSCAGLSLVPEGGKECLEITVNSTNIMIPSDQLQPGQMELGSTETMWFFDQKEQYRKYKCRCVDTGSSTNSNHNHIDGA